MERRPRKPEVVNIGGRQVNLPNLDNINWSGSPKLVITGVIAVALLAWFVLGGPFYTVDAGEEGLVLTFGKHTKTSGPGLHFKMPWPVQTVETVNVEGLRRLEFGFRTLDAPGGTQYRSFRDDSMLLREAQMLTGDENIVNCSMALQYRVRDARDFLFNYRAGGVEDTLRDLGEAVLRQMVGDRPIGDVLRGGKVDIQQEVQAKMQELADQYGMGVSITTAQLQIVLPPEQVAEAFRDVASAREDRERIINEARAYQSAQLPEAEGRAERARQQAQGYKEARIAEAEGEVARFLALAEQHDSAPTITRSRLYLETMSELLPKLHVTIVDEHASLLNLKALGGGDASRVFPPAREAATGQSVSAQD